MPRRSSPPIPCRLTPGSRRRPERRARLRLSPGSLADWRTTCVILGRRAPGIATWTIDLKQEKDRWVLVRRPGIGSRSASWRRGSCSRSAAGLPACAAVTREEVERAIREGVRFLKQEQRADGSWADVQGEARTGTTSLVTLALLTAGEKPDSPRSKAPRVPARLRARSARQHLRDRAADHGLRRRRARARPQSGSLANVDWLERAQIKPGDPVYWPGSWTYSELEAGPARRQLEHAVRPARACNAASEVGRAGQARGLGAGAELLGAQPEARRQLGLHARFRRLDRQHDLRGDLEPDHHRAASGSRGRSSSRARRSQNCGKGGVNPSLQRGIDWLANHFQVGQNFGDGQQWKFYYLYGLERAGRLAGVRFFGQHDWYRLGAEELVHEQNKLSGFWQGALVESDKTVATSFALLFLAKGRAPVLINKLRHGPRGDWNNDPDDVRNIVAVVSRDWKSLLTWQVVDPAAATVADLLQAPIVFFNGHQAPEFDASAKQNLREFVEQGGFIFADACCGSPEFDDGFKRAHEGDLPRGRSSSSGPSPTSIRSGGPSTC